MPLIDRPRLAPFFAFSSTVRLLVLLAPAGYGKSVVARSFLPAPRWLHYRVGRERTTFARFVRGFAQAVAAVAPGAQASFPRAWERALQSGSPQAVLARWLCEHLHDTDVDLVIDDLHEASADPGIATFIDEFVRIRSDRRLVITARIAGLLPIPLWMATGVMTRPIDETELRFDVSEARALARACGDEREDVARLCGEAGAYPVALAYAMVSAPARCGDAVGEFDRFESLADDIFGRLSPRARQFLLSASLLPSLRPDLLAACGWTDWRTLCDGMAGAAPFMLETHEDDSPRFHDRFADYLDEQMAYEESSLRIALAQRAVHVLQNGRQHADALYTAVRQGLVNEIDELLEKHGFQILESGRVDEIGEALSAIDSLGSSTGAVVMAIRGYVDARLGRFDTSEAWFQLGLERAANEALRVTIALYYACELMHQFRDDAFAILEPYADSLTLRDDLLIDVRSSLGQAYMVADRASDAATRTAQALSMIDFACPAPLRARVLARAAYVAFERGDASTARAHAMLAAPLAIAEGLFDVATSVYSVLYTIAYEIDDDPNLCLQYLRCVHDYGMKSGSIRVDLYALVGTYELYCEAGDRCRLAELDRAIGAVDVKYATLSFLESFLPARAMQAGWGGDFAYAYFLLAPTADQQATPLRKALRWSEVALYAAACGDRSSAHAAAAAAQACLAHGGPQTTHRAFTTLNCALAFCVLNEIEQACQWVQRAADAAMPEAQRVRAFGDAVASMIEAFADPLCYCRAMPAALEALRRCSFGGVALLIESLPCPRTGDDYRDAITTVGSRIAAQRLDTLYLAAVNSSEAEVALFAWLDSACKSDVDSRAIVRALPYWTPPPAATSTRAKSLAHKVRAFDETRSVAPAFVSRFGRDDDVDVRIDMLFADLKLAAPLMAEHSQAVSAWCTRIARRLGLDEAQIAYVTRCGLMHDIGKVKTPEAILNAPRKLEAAEWQIMRDHAAEGGRIASAIPALARFIPIIRGHHERLDGKGYPDGLRAGAIPLAARIVTVADCFNAMIGRRPYRLPMSPMEALGELDRNRDTQFDPEVVDAMNFIVVGLASSRGVLSAI